MFKKIQKIHFVGIGGIGMSGIAEVLLNLGYKVTGSDQKLSPVTERLKSLGGEVQEGHRSQHVQDANVVVISSAVPGDNVEVLEARRRNIPVISRAEMLAELMRLKYGIAVAGAHGKTTTTSMVSTVLVGAGLDPTVVIGGRLNTLGSNAKLGSGDFMVAEADESDGSFLRLSPTLAVITNIDREHLDYYRDLDHIKSAFLTFANKVPFYGAAILCLDDPNVRSILPQIERRQITYGSAPQADLVAAQMQFSRNSTRFAVRARGEILGDIQLRIPGHHNVLNALAAVAVGLDLEIPFETIRQALGGFWGADRRFQWKGEVDGVAVVDDYGHHPTEIVSTLNAARQFSDGRLVVIFQPHRFTRTKFLFEEFSRSFGQADILVVTRIYAAGEKPLEGVHSEALVAQIKKQGHGDVTYIDQLSDVVPLLKDKLRPGDLVLTLGAGDVWKVGEELLRRLKPETLKSET
ncbi:MAG: UDP-N-acetylmuramate--L-alanine ligase [Acidobacteria bacterium]|nr:UDP-N-acetylmuramate--L-alanine ligase [Acidobacteriota bacterium]